METIVNICDESGEPCQPEWGNETNCIWQIVAQDPCEKVFDCNPMGDVDLGTQVCEIETDAGILFGEQQVWCNKGQIQYGPCIPCEEEICDGLDNDCDGVVDEGDYPCETECGPGSAICVDGEIVLCNAPTAIPEVCNGCDDDCDGDIDEDLIDACETVCESGVRYCVNGQWGSCTAQQPQEEVCDGLDNDCDTLVDEDLECACPPEMVGFLMPCMEDPLLCGQGFKTCECADEECSATQMTECLAMCHWLPPDPNVVCDPFMGIITDEVCNNFDDNCNQLIDEDLVAACYTGPEETMDVGICHAGEMLCSEGQWGNSAIEDGPFLVGFCLDEQLPLEEDLCSGQDDNCDGLIENPLEETDILFIVDTSGSMSSTINAVQQAMSMFSAYYSDQEVIQWGLVVGPVDHLGGEALQMSTNLVPFMQFLPALAALNSANTGNEMLNDALFLSIRNLVTPGDVPALPPLSWVPNTFSTPGVNNWQVNWREDAHHVVIVFSDEQGQSYLNPDITQELIIEWAAAADDLSIHTFSKPANENGPTGWGPVSLGGGWSPLTSNAATMFDELMGIIDEEACGGGDDEEGAFLFPVPGLSNPIDGAGGRNGFTKYMLVQAGGACLGSCAERHYALQQSSPHPSPTYQLEFVPMYSWEEQLCLSGWP